MRRRHCVPDASAAAAAAAWPACSPAAAAAGGGGGQPTAGSPCASSRWPGRRSPSRPTSSWSTEWNAAHPDVQVEYVQGSWDSVHDQLLTSFEGGEAPDIIHDASDDLADFAYGGYLADLRDLLPARLKADIPQQSWETATFGDGVYGVPFLQEPRVLIANAKMLQGVRGPHSDPRTPLELGRVRGGRQGADAGEGDVRRRLAAEGARLRHPQPRPVHAAASSSTAARTAR